MVCFILLGRGMISRLIMGRKEKPTILLSSLWDTDGVIDVAIRLIRKIVFLTLGLVSPELRRPKRIQVIAICFCCCYCIQSFHPLWETSDSYGPTQEMARASEKCWLITSTTTTTEDSDSAHSLFLTLPFLNFTLHVRQDHKEEEHIRVERNKRSSVLETYCLWRTFSLPLCWRLHLVRGQGLAV